MNKPLVSTITPCFRMGKYLPRFLEWLPKQTFFDKLEIVLDHNEPTNEETTIVKEFQKKYPGRLKHIIVDKVDPIGVSMNRCIKEASGEFLTIWNVDDLRTDDSIETQSNLLLKNPNIDIAYGDYWVVNKFGKLEGKLADHSKYDASELTRGMILGPFFMFRKKLLDKSGIFDEQLKSGADFDLAIRLSLCGGAQQTEKPLGCYLDEGKGASTKPGSLQPIERTVVELRYFIWDKLFPEYIDKALNYNIFQIKQNGNWEPISKYIPDYKNLGAQQQKHWNTGSENTKRKKKERRQNKIKYLLYKLGLFRFVRRLI